MTLRFRSASGRDCEATFSKEGHRVAVRAGWQGSEAPTDDQCKELEAWCVEQFELVGQGIGAVHNQRVESREAAERHLANFLNAENN